MNAVVKESAGLSGHLDVTFSREDKALIIHFRDDLLDSEIAEAVKAEFHSVIGSVSEKEVEVMVLVFEGVSRIDSRALGTIISVWKFISTYRGSWSVCMTGVGPRLEDFFRLCKLHHIFNIFPTVESAVAVRGSVGLV